MTAKQREPLLPLAKLVGLGPRLPRERAWCAVIRRSGV